jgi:hypothetical protein
VARCSEVSRAAGERLAATATAVQNWLLVEVRMGWSRDVASSSALPEDARASMAVWLARTEGSRLLFIRRPGRATAASLAFVVRSDERASGIRRLELGSLDDLERVDLDADGEVVEDGLVLVCGHGSRDQCCGLRGTAVFGALADELGAEQLWLSSHQGGHRFAANLVVLPAGLQFGRVEPEEAAAVVTCALSGSIDLEHYRGRTHYEPVVQAAEHAIRAELGLTGTGDLRLLEVAGLTVRFRDADGVEHAATVEEVEGATVPASCGEEPAPQRALVATVL